ncbi:hypothetical protein C0995_013316 [Termitomyces sp. Mi166|nr:hypothetical protein C0995_013316 [Termitomyces sp. Mi166\
MADDQAQDIQAVIQGPSDVEWKRYPCTLTVANRRYEMRREAQEILPGLFLGPFMASKSMETLAKLGITHIICVRDLKESFSVKPRFEKDFVYLTLDVEDNEEQNLIRVFPQYDPFSYTFMPTKPNLVTGRNNLLIMHSVLVAAFLYTVTYYKITWEESLHLVQNRRYCISPNGGFLTQIKEYEAIYKANQALASFPAAVRGVARRKREDNEDEDEDEREDKRAWLFNEPEPVYDPNAMETS